MPYLYLIISVFGIAASSIFGTYFNRKNLDKTDTIPLYSFMLHSTVLAFWAIMFIFDRTLDWKVVPYSLGFALGFGVCSISMVYALKTGPTVLTSLMLQLSLIGVTVWGFFFWNTVFTWIVALGIILIVLSLWLCLYTKKQEENKITWRWIFWVSLVFIGNATCTIFQKTQQMQFDGKYGNFMMMIASFCSMSFCLVMYLRSNKSDSKEIIRTSWQYPVLAGTLNSIMNLCVILLATSVLSPSMVYPVLAVGSLAVTTIFSAFVFKEKMRWWQWLGVLVGAVAVALLSL